MYRLLGWKPGPGICDFTLEVQHVRWQPPKFLRWMFGDRAPINFKVFGSCTSWRFLPDFEEVYSHGELNHFLRREYARINHTIASAEERRIHP